MYSRREFLGASAAWAAAPLQGQRTKNVLVVMSDGLRWQDVFRGADKALLNKESGVADVSTVRHLLKREELLPFLWGTVAKQGQVFGNRDQGSEAYVTNGFNFSYPGYSETFCGYGDPRVDSNDKKHNPNVNVLEWLNRKPEYAGKVAAFGAWDLFPWILNSPRSGILVNAGYEPLTVAPLTERIKLLNRVKRESEYWEGESFDAPTFLTAMEYFKEHKPRVFFVSLGETDEWAHHGEYDLYLKSANRFDQYARELWETAESMPEYRGSTSLILAVDHGRGEGPKDWRSHGEKLPESKHVWMGFMGPDTQAHGERKNGAPVTQSQIASTIAALLGHDFTEEAVKAAKPIQEVLGL